MALEAVSRSVRAAAKSAEPVTTAVTVEETRQRWGDAKEEGAPFLFHTISCAKSSYLVSAKQKMDLYLLVSNFQEFLQKRKGTQGVLFSSWKAEGPPAIVQRCDYHLQVRKPPCCLFGRFRGESETAV